ncbi:ZRANB2 [Branchiostoma lanceolatum]|uniref:ZRANB2 protein n=1 Tax=Branchiostoma lanceolatum TaxID=7740 RepID=A0A8J9YW64_BRALA|nr:ZRANB2 [Branchiostoma lanceolatum]
MNFARRTSCNRCGKVYKDSKAKVIRTGGVEIGKAAAEKSKGLFSADDWQCKTCGNVNWARRNECNMCKAPKYGKMEERTGYGGGYNEREDVEYVEREESDGEYDEFGRKKKKFRGSISKASTPPKQETREKEEKEEVEEEEEEGDVSKYDLDSDEVGKTVALCNTLKKMMQTCPSISCQVTRKTRLIKGAAIQALVPAPAPVVLGRPVLAPGLGVPAPPNHGPGPGPNVQGSDTTRSLALGQGAENAIGATVTLDLVPALGKGLGLNVKQEISSLISK